MPKKRRKKDPLEILDEELLNKSKEYLEEFPEDCQMHDEALLLHEEAHASLVRKQDT